MHSISSLENVGMHVERCEYLRLVGMLYTHNHTHTHIYINNKDVTKVLEKVRAHRNMSRRKAGDTVHHHLHHR